MNIAIDTNLVLSSTFKLDTTPAKLLAAWRMKRFAWITCSWQLDELTDALLRPRVVATSIGGMSAAQNLVQSLRTNAYSVTLLEPLPSICRDQDDDFLFALHDQGHVNAIVSGDKDVLALRPRYPVLTAKELIDRL